MTGQPRVGAGDRERGTAPESEILRSDAHNQPCHGPQRRLQIFQSRDMRGLAAVPSPLKNETLQWH